MKIAIISHLYPNEINPHHGKFIQDHVHLFGTESDISIDLIIPTPYSIPFTNRWKNNHANFLQQNSRINRVYYLSLPAKKFPHVIQQSISKKLARFLNSNNYDLIHLHWLYPDGMSIPELSKMGHKTVLTIHGSDWYQNFDNPTLKTIIDDTIQNVDYVLFSGHKLKTDVEKVYPDLTYKSNVAYNIVDTCKYKPLTIDQKNTLRNSLGWNSSKTHALTVANIRHEKGVDLLVDTIIKNKELSNIQFHLIGEKDNSEYSNLVMDKIRTNPYKNIQYIPPIKPNELIKFYQAADFYILPSRREGFNVSILEAASCGLPLLCTNVGGNKQVTDLGAGFVTNDFNSHCPSDILKMATSFSDYNPNSLNKKIKQNFGIDVFKNRLKNTYKTIL